jgi:4'-phosphopantetheinyl transferase EntD
MQLRAGIQELFGSRAIAVVAAPEQTPAPLAPAEERFVRGAVAKRRHEFRLGRHCAHAALRELGVPDADAPIEVGPRRAPVWPAGVVGSITHCDGLCAAVVAFAGDHRGIGIDAEPAEPLPSDVRTAVCTQAEIEWARGAGRFETEGASGPHVRGDWERLFFCAKEAVYKCIFPVTGEELDFQDVEIRIDLARGSFTAAAVTDRRASARELGELQGRFRAIGGHLATGAVLPG